MQRGLFFTTMRNHRPVYIPTSTPPSVSVPSTTKEISAVTSSKTNVTKSNELKNISVSKQLPSLHSNIVRSNQPIFSVSAMFGVRSGGRCGSCGH